MPEELTYPNAVRLLEPTTPEDPRWHQLRRTGVGGSEAAPLMGEGYKNHTAYNVWLHKVSTTEEQFDEATLKLFERGHRLEPIAAQLFNEQHPELSLREEGLLRSTLNPYMTCTPDRITSDNGGLELKTAGLFATKKFTSSCPRNYYWQAIQCLKVTGRSHWYVFALHPDSWNTWEWIIDANDPQVQADMNLLDLTVLDFWESHVLTETPPEDHAHFEPQNIIEGGKNLTDDDDLNTYLALLDRREELNDEIKLLESEKKAIDSTLKDAAGDHEEVHLNGQVLWAYKTSVRSGIDSKKLKAEHPDLYNKYKTESKVRSLNVPTSKKDK